MTPSHGLEIRERVPHLSRILAEILGFVVCETDGLPIAIALDPDRHEAHERAERIRRSEIRDRAITLAEERRSPRRVHDRLRDEIADQDESQVCVDRDDLEAVLDGLAHAQGWSKGEVIE